MPIFRLFLKNFKTGDFDPGISPLKRHLKKNGVYHNKGHGKCKRIVISEFGFSNFCHFWKKAYRCKLVLSLSTSKLVLIILIVGPFVLAQFLAKALIIFWLVKNRVFCWKFLTDMIVFLSYLHENRVSTKTSGVQIAPLRQAGWMDTKNNAEDLCLGFRCSDMHLKWNISSCLTYVAVSILS